MNKILIIKYLLVVFSMTTYFFCYGQNMSLKIFKNPTMPDVMRKYQLTHEDSASNLFEIVSFINDKAPRSGNFDFWQISSLYSDSIVQLNNKKDDEHATLLSYSAEMAALQTRLNLSSYDAYNPKNQENFKSLFAKIKELPASKEKIHLLIECQNCIYTTPDKLDEKMFQTSQMVNDILSRIKYSRESIYGNIIAGDMFRNASYYYHAIGYYIKARELVDMAAEDEFNNKNEWQGNLCEKIAYLYSHNKLNFDLTKSATYHNLAANYYNLAKRPELAIQSSLLSRKEALEDIDVSKREIPNDSFNVSDIKMVAIDAKRFLLQANDPAGQNIANKYLLNWCAGKLCSEYANDTSAISYFNAALTFAIQLKERKEVQLTLEELYQCFSKQKNSEAKKEIRKLLTILNLTADYRLRFSANMAYTKSLMVEGYVDSALHILNSFEYDERINNIINSFEGYEIFRKIYQLKRDIYEMKNVDSAVVYRERLYKMLIFENTSYNFLVNTEFIATNSWLERKVDSELLLKSKNIRTRNGLIAALLAIAILLAIISWIINLRRRAEKKIGLEETKRIRAEKQNEINRINNLIRNNVHNLQSDRGILTNLIATVNNGGNSKLAKYNEFYNKYLKTAERNWTKEIVSLSDALESAKNYVAALQVRYPKISLSPIEESVGNFERIKFIPAAFETLVNNSVFRGLRWKSFAGSIRIEVNRSNEYLICVVKDDGEPPKSQKAYFRRTNSGLHLLRKQIENMYYQNSRVIPAEFCEVSIQDNRRGTIVKMLLPYEEI